MQPILVYCCGTTRLIKVQPILVYCCGTAKLDKVTFYLYPSAVLLLTSGMSLVCIQSMGLPTYCLAETMSEKANMQVVVTL